MAPAVTKVAAMRADLLKILPSAFLKRDSREKESECVRLFQGETEGDPRIYIEKFGPRFDAPLLWVFEKEREGFPIYTSSDRAKVIRALEEYFRREVMIDGASVGDRVEVNGADPEGLVNGSSKNGEGPARGPSIYWLFRPHGKLPAEEPELMVGAGAECFEASELGVRYILRTKKSRHPGVFLDHFPLRKWMIHSGQVRGTVLNTFSYTGSLSCAAFKGGASSVLTLDLSKPTIEWARENWALNEFPTAAGDFIFGDVLEWLPKFKKKDRLFDNVILDPPSFSRGKAGTFSTERDGSYLHELALDVLAPGGLLISSINSETISQQDFNRDLRKVLQSQKKEFQWVMDLCADPVGFPGATHLKGAVVRVG